MCDCLTRFQTNKPSLSLPFDPASILCSPSPELVIEYKEISGKWSVFVQKVLVGVINHNGSRLTRRIPNVIDAIKKKRARRPKMSGTQKSMVIQLLKQNEPADFIAKQAGVTLRAVYDQKYQLGKQKEQHSISANGQ